MPEVETVPAAPTDEQFLFEVYASTRRPEVAAWGWNAVQQEQFLRMQYRAQQQSYAMQFPGADCRVIRHGGAPVGRIIIVRTPEEIRLADIALLPEFRSTGIGSVLIRELQAEAAGSGRPLRLHVDRTNPAMRLYERLGFRATGEDAFQYAMEWRTSE